MMRYISVGKVLSSIIEKYKVYLYSLAHLPFFLTKDINSSVWMYPVTVRLLLVTIDRTQTKTRIKNVGVLLLRNIELLDQTLLEQIKTLQVLASLVSYSCTPIDSYK
jgi:hypothetical protein